MWWMSKATVTYTGSAWTAGTWSVPVRVTGEEGTPGADGKFWDYKYRVAATQPAKPSGLQPTGWYDQPPAVTSGNFLWMSYCEKNADQSMLIQDWTTPVRISGEQGEKGPKGDNPAPVYRGDYSGSAVYYGTSSRVDIVKYNSYYYVAKPTAGNGFAGVTPTNTAYWEPFGAQFESIATKLLLAVSANVAGWIFANNRLESPDGSVFLDGANGKISLGSGKIILNKDGSGQLANGNVAWDAGGNVTVNGVVYAKRGLRLGIKTTASTNTLTAEDCYVNIVGGTNPLYLPGQPAAGQMLYIINQNGSSSTINGNGKKISNRGTLATTVSLASNECCILIYTDTEWYVFGRY
jgi:hypothetical protein